jgi:hypothetical protein
MENYCFPSNNIRGHLVLFLFCNLSLILYDPFCLSFEIHQMTAATIQGKTVELLGFQQFHQRVESLAYCRVNSRNRQVLGKYRIFRVFL